LPEETETVFAALATGDFTGAYAPLAVESNWLNNMTNVVAGQPGEIRFGTGSTGTKYYVFYTSSDCMRIYADNRITDATLISALQNSANWTANTYNASLGDYGQRYIDNTYEYVCVNGAGHVWYRNLIVSQTTTTTDASFLPKLQLSLGKADNSTIEIEAKYDIISIIVEAETTTAGDISIGSADGLSDVVASTALPTIIGTKKRLIYIINPDFPKATNRTLYVNISSAATVKINILIQKMFA